ncbi:MAG TPA: hypothetical protein VEO37_12200 [Thermoanaerobaculia bacterium]|nr:hypothetical protein [Thermoanaerobaculia bacterium]
MKRVLVLVIGALFSAAFALAAEQTWSGKISDSDCGRSHKSAIEHAGKKMSDHDCVIACVKDHGAKYVFVSGGKIYNISNQDYAGLEEHAAHDIKLTGEMTGDTIKVSKIEMAGKSNEKKGSEKKY